MIKNLTKKNKGFTLIELLMVVIIIGILLTIAIPNFIAARDRAIRASLKTNMHVVQSVVEVYSIDWGGLYPDNRAIMYNAALAGDYWEDMRNPLSGLIDPITDISDFTSSTSTPPYSVLYGGSQSSSNGFVASVYPGPPDESSYVIYGTNAQNAPFTVKGEIFYYSNN